MVVGSLGKRAPTLIVSHGRTRWLSPGRSTHVDAYDADRATLTYIAAAHGRMAMVESWPLDTATPRWLSPGRSTGGLPIAAEGAGEALLREVVIYV